MSEIDIKSQVPGVEHAAITSLGQNHLAVMGSLEEGVFLQLVSFTLKCFVFFCWLFDFCKFLIIYNT